jgi:hypothetical protein
MVSLKTEVKIAMVELSETWRNLAAALLFDDFALKWKKNSLAGAWYQRPSAAGPVRDLLGGEASPAVF